MPGPSRRYLEEQIARLDAQIAHLEHELKVARVVREGLAEGLSLLASEQEALHSGTELGTPSGTMIQAQTVPLKRRGRKLTSDGPVARAAKRAKISMADIAARMKVEYGVVKAWNRRGNVPEKYREAFADACKPSKT